eukprot:m.262653 g.262653  ORF g.262653 m.262653 type:complete len:200 (-) comp25662_c0_seq1:821-1420(-)
MLYYDNEDMLATINDPFISLWRRMLFEATEYKDVYQYFHLLENFCGTSREAVVLSQDAILRALLLSETPEEPIFPRFEVVGDVLHVWARHELHNKLGAPSTDLAFKDWLIERVPLARFVQPAKVTNATQDAKHTWPPPSACLLPSAANAMKHPKMRCGRVSAFGSSWPRCGTPPCRTRSVPALCTCSSTHTSISSRSRT